MASETPKLSLWTGQGLHAAGVGLLLAGTAAAYGTLAPLEGKFLGVSSDIWFWASITAPILHQVYVWLCWRLEFLHSKAISRSLGFSGYQAGFFILIWGRVATLALLAWANRGSLPLPPTARALLGALPLPPSAYALYSVVRYFGMSRAAGADHFDEKYGTMPLVREGIFRWTSHGMYGVAFLGFWGLAFALGSAGALLAAAFNHAYIWVHFYATEKPDMEFLYGKARRGLRGGGKCFGGGNPGYLAGLAVCAARSSRGHRASGMFPRKNAATVPGRARRDVARPSPTLPPRDGVGLLY